MNQRCALLLLCLAALLFPAEAAKAQTVNATFNTSADVPVTASSYIASGTVNFTLNCALATGTNLKVVNNTGLNFIQGAFSNLAQGQQVTLSFGGINYNFVANYYGGTGNDLVLQWANNRLLAWGLNSSGQLGTGNATNSLVPIAVNNTGALAGKTVVQVCGGESHSVALCSDGTVVTWGSNDDGELGNGTTTSSDFPVVVSTVGTALAGKTVVAVAAGGFHCLALCSDGTVVSWGYNSFGQLGNGNNSDSTVPVAVVTSGTALDGKTVVALAAGDHHSLGLCSDGTVAGWGDDDAGQLGNGITPAGINTPVAVSTAAGSALFGKSVVSLASGGHHALALCSDGTLAVWGNNAQGQLGNNSTTNALLPTTPTIAGAALAGKTVVKVAAGFEHSVVLCSDGSLVAWGENVDGQLGNNSTASSLVPVAVTTAGTPLQSKTVTALFAAQMHNLVQCSDGTLATWGYGADGELGDNSTSNSSVPVAVSTASLTAGEVFAAAGTGQDASHNFGFVAEPAAPQIAVQQPAGTGLASNSSTVNFGGSSVGTGVPLTFTILNNGSAALAISGATVAGTNSADFSVTTAPSSLVAIGGSTTCVVTFNPTSGSAIVRNASLQILSNDPVFSSFSVNLTGSTPGTLSATFNGATDVPLTATNLAATGSTVNFTLNFAPVTGTNLTVVNNTGQSFIQGAFGNLSQGQTVTLNFGGTNYSFVANYYGGTGNDLVLQWANTRLLAWGAGGSGQLGNNTTADSTLPVPVIMTGVLSGKTVTQVALGVSHCLALCADGTLAAWGANGNGQLGNNSTTQSLLPIAVITTGAALAGKTVIAVTAGRNHSAALCSDGTVATWGAGSSGQLGNGGVTDSHVPVAVDTTGVLSGKAVIAIAASNASCLALCSDGTLVSWGFDGDGDLGNGGATNSSLPVAVVTAGTPLAGKKVVAISGGYDHFLVRCSDGTLAAWGNAGQGELGDHSSANSAVPVAVDTTGVLAGKTVAAQASGSYHNLVLCSDGTVADWGYDAQGELGNGSNSSSFFPVAWNTAGTALAGKTVIGLGAGFEGSAAVCSDGTLAAWGENVHGQLGNGTTAGSSVPLAVSNAALAPGEMFVSATSGQSAEGILAVVATPPEPVIAVQASNFIGHPNLPNGATDSFGSLPVGQGLQVTITVLNNGAAPLVISGTSLDGINAADFSVISGPASPVAIGSSTSMVVSFSPTAATAIVRNAALHIATNDPNTGSFTLNLQGFSSGTLAAAFNSPSDVALTASHFVATASTVNFTLNYALPPGTSLMVVNNTGNDPIFGNFSNLTQGQLVTLTYNGVNYFFVANYFGGTGNDLVLQWAQNRIVAWGLNGNGQLGNNSTTTSLVPAYVNTSGALLGKVIVAVSAGIGHSLALCSDGTVVAWGQNNFGQLGNNSTTESHLPVTVQTTGTALAGKTVIAISAGDHHSLALCSDGTVVGWGDNDAGQLGNNQTANSPVAVALTTAGTPLVGKTVVAISAGGFHNMALCSDSTAVIWGENAQGELGNNSTINGLVPISLNMTGVLAGKTISVISAGYEHSVVLCTDGTLAAWGLNDVGQLGNGTQTNSPVPILVPTAGTPLAGETITAISAGGHHTIVACADGSMAAWGDDASGQLGNGKMSTTSTPVSVTITGSALAGKTLASLVTGEFHAMALGTDGSLAVWGSNGNGQLGINSTTNLSTAVPVDMAPLAQGETFMAVGAGSRASHSLGIVAEPPFPVVATSAATSVTTATATLNGIYNAEGNGTVAGVQYGFDATYGSSVSGSIGSDAAFHNGSFPITGLAPHTTYHFRATATNAAGTGNGADLTFTTLDTAPVANADTMNNVAGVVNIPVLGNDSDADGDSLTITGVTQGANGSVTTNGANVTYTPGASFSSTDTFSYTISDGFGGAATANVTVNAAPLQSWRVQTFGANAGNAAIASDNADPNGNGIPNLMEYALHGDAIGNTTGISILPQVSSNPSTGMLQLSFTRYEDRNDITLTVQASDSLTGTWTNLAQSVDGAPFTVITTGATVNESGSGNAISVTVGDLYQMNDPAHPQRFMRLQVTRP